MFFYCDENGKIISKKEKLCGRSVSTRATKYKGGGGGMLLIEIEYFDLFQNLPLQNKNNNHDFRKNFLCCALESFFFF